MTTTLTRSVTTSRPPRMGAGHRRRPSLGRVLAWVAMILVIVVTLFPFYVRDLGLEIGSVAVASVKATMVAVEAPARHEDER